MKRTSPQQAGKARRPTKDGGAESWTKQHATRRMELLDKQSTLSMTVDETSELVQLEKRLDRHLAVSLAPSMAYAKLLLRRLKAKAYRSQKHQKAPQTLPTKKPVR